MATILVGRWLKKGGRRLYSQQFETKIGAERAGVSAAKKKRKGWTSLGPYWTGSHWSVRIAPK